MLYRVVLSFAILASLHRLVAQPRAAIRRRHRASFGLAFFALLPLLNERTWLFTLLFSTLTLDAILDLREGRRRTGRCFPPLFALWANVHIQFIYGLFLLAWGVSPP